MTKLLKSETELLQLLNAELRKHDACKDMMVTTVFSFEHPDGSCNWDSDMPPFGECRRLFINVRFAFQQQYDLVTDE